LLADETINLKRTYLSLLPPVQLIELLLAIDADRSNHSIPIFPPNIPDAIKQLQAARQAYPHMYAHPYYYAHHLPPAKPNNISNAQASKYPSWPSNAHRPKLEAEGSKTTKTTAQQATSSEPSSSAQTQTTSASAALARAALAASESRNSDDLPSYEEMIVEAITEMNEPDGTPPKVLFAWMAAYVHICKFEANF
jgi:hypothetical protein